MRGKVLPGHGAKGPLGHKISPADRLSPGMGPRALTIRVVQQGFGQVRQEALRGVVTLTDSKGLYGEKVE